MPVKSPAHVTVALPPGVRPSDEMSEVLIRKFLKACKKEDLQKNVLDKSAMVRRFDRPANVERLRKRAAKERAIREYEKHNDPKANDKAPKKRKDKREEVKKNERI
jgi:hypothetical protein